MAKIAKQLTELIGHTPLLELTNYEKALGLEAKIIAKLEYFNPLGSVKDRVAAAMIEQGIKDGKINQDTIIIEPTSGNTGIGLAFVAASKGLHLILIMPDTMSVERRKIVTALGAEIKLTPGREGMKGAIDEAQRLKEHYGNAFIPQQFENQANPDIHRATTAQEIWEDTDGKVDIFVSSVGTGGTCTGTGLGLRDHNPDVRIVYMPLVYCKKRCGQVSLACIRKQHHNILSFVLRSFRKLCCRIYCCSRGYANEKSVALCNLSCLVKSGLILHRNHLIHYIHAHDLWNKACTDSLYLVRSRSSA